MKVIAKSATVLFLAAVSMSANTHAGTAGGEILAALHARVQTNGDIDEVYEAVEELSNSEQKELYKQVERAWPKLRGNYESKFARTAKSSSGKVAEHKNRVRDLRKELAAMKNLADGPMKVALKKRGMPALNELRTLLLPNPKTIMLTADDATKKERKTILAVAGLRDTLIESAIIPSTISSAQELEQIEQDIARSLSGLDRKGVKIMEKNRKIAAKEKVPDDERRGAEDTNLMRLLMGYSALELDPKLCAASRDHSKDMATLGFFAHESPVKGKKTPWDRAKNFGTSASGENIYAGSSDPLSANKGWFFSPGHHRNMFGGHRRIGHGRHGGHWTQLFGR
ncbi:MAG: CAP domain-containing protein [Akkermansiaceae bacterium]